MYSAIFDPSRIVATTQECRNFIDIGLLATMALCPLPYSVHLFLLPHACLPSGNARTRHSAYNQDGMQSQEIHQYRRSRLRAVPCVSHNVRTPWLRCCPGVSYECLRRKHWNPASSLRKPSHYSTGHSSHHLSNCKTRSNDTPS